MAKENIDKERILRYFRGEYSEKDASYVKEIFSDNYYEDELRALLSDQFNELISVKEAEVRNFDHNLKKIHRELNARDISNNRVLRSNISNWVLRIAAILVLPFIVLSILQYNKTHLLRKALTLKEKAWLEIKAPAWSRVQFCLPDGTTGWLNSNSKLDYDENFLTDRKIELEGEAFFDVARDEERPFLVNTGDLSINVLGTRFNIASYEDEKDVEVVLEHGSLIVYNKVQDKSYSMNPGELVLYNKSLDEFSDAVTVQPQKYVSWKEGKLIFRNDPLDVVVRRMERWYNIDIELEGNNIEDLRLRATFSDENLEEVLYFLKLSLSIEYRIENGRLDDNGLFVKKKVIINTRKPL